MNNKKPVTAIIVGAGHRSMFYSLLADEEPELLRIVGVADPDPVKRRLAAEKFNMPEDMIFNSAEELAEKPKIADVIINGTMDKDHVPTAVPLLSWL